MTTLTATEASTLLAELVERFSTPQLNESCEVCASMLAEQGGITNDMATRKLKEMAKAGELEEHPAIWKGRRVRAYRRTNAKAS